MALIGGALKMAAKSAVSHALRHGVDHVLKKFNLPAPRDVDRSPLARVGSDALQQRLTLYENRLKHLPGLGRQLVMLVRVEDLPSLRRGVLGELNTAVRLEAFGVRVLDIARPVYDLNGSKFSDLDVVTRSGSVVEVRDWASRMNVSDLRDKIQRLCTLRDAGVAVDGIAVSRLYLYAPGGLSQAALELVRAAGVEVLLSIQDLRRVQ